VASMLATNSVILEIAEIVRRFVGNPGDSGKYSA